MLFEGRYQRLVSDARNYDVAPNGERFLMLKAERDAEDLVVVINWHQELLERVPSRASR